MPHLASRVPSADHFFFFFFAVTFFATLAVAFLAEAAGHHPDIDIRWRKVVLALTTHDAGGLTEKDFQLAAQIERQATQTVIKFGFVVVAMKLRVDDGCLVPGPVILARAGAKVNRSWEKTGLKK